MKQVACVVTLVVVGAGTLADQEERLTLFYASFYTFMSCFTLQIV